MEVQLKSRLYKNFSHEELSKFRRSPLRYFDSDKDQSSLLTRAESTKVLIPKVTLRSKNEISIGSTLPFRIENGKFIVRHESVDLNKSLIDASKFHHIDED